MFNKKQFDLKLKELKECQIKNNFDSCMKCDVFLECELRKEYVLSVYQSMNEDMKQGGFDFN